jgi:hypothetical protein
VGGGDGGGHGRSGGEGGQSGGDGIVAARLDLDAVWRVGVDQVDRLPAQQAVHVVGLAAVAAEQAMDAEAVQVAGPGDGLVGRLGHVVGVGQPRVRPRRQQPPQRVVGEAGEGEVELHLPEPGQLQGQLVVVPARQGRGLVVGQAVGLGLGGRQARGDVDGDLLQPQHQGGLVARVADDDHALLVHDDRLAEAEFPDRRDDGVHGGVVDPRVVLVRADAAGRT